MLVGNNSSSIITTATISNYIKNVNCSENYFRTAVIWLCSNSGLSLNQHLGDGSLHPISAGGWKPTPDLSSWMAAFIRPQLGDGSLHQTSAGGWQPTPDLSWGWQPTPDLSWGFTAYIRSQLGHGSLRPISAEG